MIAELNAFLGTFEGQIFSYALLAFGLAELVMIKFLFGQKFKAAQEQLLFAASENDKIKPQQTIDSMLLVMNTMRFAAVMLIIVGIYGITRS